MIRNAVRCNLSVTNCTSNVGRSNPQLPVLKPTLPELIKRGVFVATFTTPPADPRSFPRPCAIAADPLKICIVSTPCISVRKPVPLKSECTLTPFFTTGIPLYPRDVKLSVVLPKVANVPTPGEFLTASFSVSTP